MKNNPSAAPAWRQQRRRSGHSRRSAPDITWWLLPAFAALLAVQIVLAFSAIRFWRIEADALADLKTLVAANELLAEAGKSSFEIGRLAFQATVATDPRNIEKYRDRLHVKSAAALDESLATQLIRNPVREALRDLGTLRSETARLGEAESRRLETVSGEFDNLLRIDERVLAALEGRFEDENGEYTVVDSPDPDAARDTLRDQSYQARRNDLGEDLLALQAAFDVRVLALITEISRNSTIFFPLALACAALLVVATPVLGWRLHTHLLQSVAIHKTQIRKMNEDLSRLLGQLSKSANERDESTRHPAPPTPPAGPHANGTPPPAPPARPSPPHLNDLPASANTYPGGLAEDYLSRLP